MKLLRSILAAGMAFAMSVTLLAGCASGPDGSASSGGSVSASQSTPDGSVPQDGPITLNDHAGRTVTLEEPAQRIVSSYYLSTSLLIALGLKDNLVGIEMKADTRQLFKLAAPELLDLPAVGSGKGINVEETAALEPDLVVIPMNLAESAAQFDALNIPCIVIEPETLDNFLDTIDLLGQATGTQDRAAQLADFHRSAMEDVTQRCAQVEEKPLVYLAGSDFLRTAPSGMYQNGMIEAAGGVNAAGELTGSDWVDISAEELMDWNPQRIFMVSYSDFTEADILSDSRFASLDAVKNGQIFLFPSPIEPWDYPTASSALGFYWLAAQLHPDVITPEEYVTIAEDFYRTFFNISVTDDDLGVLSLMQPAA